jgi:hypothetical protein
MPQNIYTVEIDGKQYVLEGDHPPTEAEARAAIGSAPAEKSGPDWDYAPTLGGMVGGIGGLLLGGPMGAVAGATAGGAIGGAAKTYMQSPDSETRGADTAIGGAVEGIKQGALEAGPQMISGLLRKAAPHAMDMGLQRTPTDRLNFPNTPKRLVDEGIIPTGDRPQKALSATEGQVQARTTAYDAAHPVNRIDPDAMAQEARTSAYGEGKLGGLGDQPGPEDAELNRLVEEYLKQNTRTRSLGETVQQKRSYQARSKYSNRPNAPTQTSNELNFNAGIADANRSAAIKADPSLEGLLAKEQDLIGGVQAAKLRSAKSIPLETMGTVGALGRAVGLRNPTVMGGGSILMDRLGKAGQLSPAMMRAVQLALRARMQQQTE